MTPLIQPGTKSPLKITSQQQLQNANGLPPGLTQSLALDLQNIAQTVNALHTTAQQQPTVNQLFVTNQSGQVIAAIGNVSYEGVLYVNWLSELHAGAPLNPMAPTDAIFNCNTDGSCSIGNNGWFDVHDSFDGNAAWIGTQTDTLTITNAVNNGSGAIRLTVPNHTLATGNTCTVRSMNLYNVGNANGTWQVTVIDANTVDLQGSIWSGPFTLINPLPAGLPTYQATIDRVLQIAGVATSGGLFQITTSIPHNYESGTAVNIPAPGPVGNPTAVGQWVITVPQTLVVTGAVNNGSGLIRLTVPGGNYKTGDKVQVLNVGGVPNANGWWTVTAHSSTVIDLQGSTFLGTYTSGGTATYTNQVTFTLDDSTFTGAYISGGTVLQYFAGMLAESIAIGASFANYKLRAFPSGDLRIKNATIELTSAAGTILLNPLTAQITMSSNTTLAEIVLDATVPSLVFYDQTGTPDVTLEILTESALSVTAATNASPVVMTVPGCCTANPSGNPYVDGDTVYVQGATGNTIINGYRIIENVNATADTFTMTNLQGAAINGNGALAGAVTCSRYYAGLLAQSLALGANFAQYKLRFFADGSLKINNANITASVITNSSISVTNLTSTSGTAPNVLTLTIQNGLLTLGGTGTEAGKGIVTLDQLAITGQTPAPTAPTSGTAIIYYDSGTAALYYNLGGAGWVPFTAGTGQTITTPTVALQFGGASVGMSGTFTCSCVQTGKLVQLFISVVVTAVGSSTGAATLALGTIPAVAKPGTGAVSASANMALLTSSIDAFLFTSTSTIDLYLTGASGAAALTNSNFTATSQFWLALSYQST